MRGWTVRYDRERRKYVAVFEYDADESEAVAYAFGPNDGAYDEHLAAAEELRRLNDEGGAS